MWRKDGKTANFRRLRPKGSGTKANASTNSPRQRPAGCRALATGMDFAGRLTRELPDTSGRLNGLTGLYLRKRFQPIGAGWPLTHQGLYLAGHSLAPNKTNFFFPSDVSPP